MSADGRCIKHDNWHAECRKCVEEEAHERGIAEGRRLEREAVVAALRERAWCLHKHTRTALLVAADRLEKGKHTKEGA